MNNLDDPIPQWLQDELKESKAALRQSRVDRFGEEGADAFERMEKQYGLAFTVLATLRLVGDVMAKRSPTTKPLIKKWWRQVFRDAEKLGLIKIVSSERKDVDDLPLLSAITPKNRIVPK